MNETLSMVDAPQVQRQQAFDQFVAAFQDDLTVVNAQKIADDLDVSFYVEEVN